PRRRDREGDCGGPLPDTDHDWDSCTYAITHTVFHRAAVTEASPRREELHSGPFDATERTPASGGKGNASGHCLPNTRSTTQHPRTCVSEVSRQWARMSESSHPASWRASARIGIAP